MEGRVTGNHGYQTLLCHGISKALERVEVIRS